MTLSVLIWITVLAAVSIRNVRSFGVVSGTVRSLGFAVMWTVLFSFIMFVVLYIAAFLDVAY